MQWLIAYTMLVVSVGGVNGDYPCVCNFIGMRPVYEGANTTTVQLGFLSPDQCKPYMYTTPSGATRLAVIEFKQQIGYVPLDANMVQTCLGDPSVHDILTSGPPSTASTSSTTTPTPASTASASTQSTTTTRQTTSTTTTRQTTSTTTTRPIASTTTTMPITSTTTTRPIASTTTTMPITSTTTTRPITSTTTTRPIASTLRVNTFPKATGLPFPILEGRTDLCPHYILTDANRNGGFVGQFGRFCYELVATPAVWYHAEAHCKLVSGGHLLYIVDQREEDYVVRFLNSHHYVKQVWTGLNDRDTEGKLKWSAGLNVTYTNLQLDFAQQSSNKHILADCFVLKQGGEWTDAACGVSLFASIGFGEKHPYVCKYNVNSTNPNIVAALGPALIG